MLNKVVSVNECVWSQFNLTLVRRQCCSLNAREVREAGCVSVPVLCSFSEGVDGGIRLPSLPACFITFSVHSSIMWLTIVSFQRATQLLLSSLFIHSNKLILLLLLPDCMQGWRSTGLYLSQSISPISFTHRCEHVRHIFIAALCISWFELCGNQAKSNICTEESEQDEATIISSHSLLCSQRISTGNLDKAA